MSINIDFTFVVVQGVYTTITVSLILWVGRWLLKKFAPKYIKNIFAEKLVDYKLEKQQIKDEGLNLFQDYLDYAENVKKPVVADIIADNYNDGIRIYKRLYRLYRKIQDSREAIKYNSGNDKRQEKIDEFIKEINSVRKEINDVGGALLNREINDNSKFLEKLIDYVLDIPAYLSDDLSVIISRNRNGLVEYDREKSSEALFKAAQWIRKNMGGDSTHNDVELKP